jgi:hypothetical protein
MPPYPAQALLLLDRKFLKRRRHWRIFAFGAAFYRHLSAHLPLKMQKPLGDEPNAFMRIAFQSKAPSR